MLIMDSRMFVKIVYELLIPMADYYLKFVHLQKIQHKVLDSLVLIVMELLSQISIRKTFHHTHQNVECDTIEETPLTFVHMLQTQLHMLQQKVLPQRVLLL